MRVLAVSVLERAGETLGDYLPSVGGALGVLIAGLVVVRVLGRVLVKVLIRSGLDRLAERAGVHGALARAGLERSLSRVIGVAVRLALTVAVVLAAISILGLDALDDALNRAVLYLPRLLFALGLVLTGVVLAGMARERVERLSYQMDLRGPLGVVAQVAVVVIFTILALGQLGVPTDILTVLAGIVTAGGVLAGALAFGLGSRDLARELSAGRYVRAGFHVGQEVTIGDDRGEIVAIEAASTILRTDDGRTLRLPHSEFLAFRVVLHTGGPAG